MLGLICTGDNDLSALAVAKEVGIVNESHTRIIKATAYQEEPCSTSTTSPDEQPIVVWNEIENYYNYEEESSCFSDSSDDEASSIIQEEKVARILTGAALRTLYANGKLHDVLSEVVIVSDATAQDKFILVVALQEAGHIVGMYDRAKILLGCFGTVNFSSRRHAFLQSRSYPKETSFQVQQPFLLFACRPSI